MKRGQGVKAGLAAGFGVNSGGCFASLRKLTDRRYWRSPTLSNGAGGLTGYPYVNYRSNRDFFPSSPIWKMFKYEKKKNEIGVTKRTWPDLTF